jgi:DNA-binding transcriptional ArsR family regulator/phage tail protein X
VNELGVLESCTEDIAALRREAEIADETPLFRLLTPAELDESRDVPYLIEDLIAPGDLVIIWGDAKAGKTFVTLDLLASMALGKPFIGKPTNRPVKVVYATAEGRRGIKHRIRGLTKQHGVTLEELNDRLRICLDLPNLHTGEGVEAFFAECRAFGADVVVLDTFARASLGMDENAAKDMNPALAALDPYLKEGMTVILPHHANKAGDLRGSTGMHGAGDLFLQVKRTNDGRRSLVFHMAKDTTEFPEAYFKIVPAPGADSLKEVAVEWAEPSSRPVSKTTVSYMNRREIIELLMNEHVGTSNAITANNIANAIGSTGPTVRKHLDALKAENMSRSVQINGLRWVKNKAGHQAYYWDAEFL